MQEQRNERINIMKDIYNRKLKISEIEGRIAGQEEIIEKYLKPIYSSLDEHLKSTSQQINYSCNAWKDAERENKEKAIEFCQDKTCDELKMYLAERPVAYNAWKDADLDTLMMMVIDVYEM